MGQHMNMGQHNPSQGHSVQQMLYMQNYPSMYGQHVHNLQSVDENDYLMA
jgi:hypothetical protein